MATVIQYNTLGIQRKVTKLPCFWYFVFRTHFQHFLGVFGRSFFAVQLALVSMITITLTSYLTVFSLQRTRLFGTRGEQGRTRGEQGLYFEMLRRLNLWLFSWLSHRSRKAQNCVCRCCLDWSTDYRSLSVILDGHCSVIFQSNFKNKTSLERSFPALNDHALLFSIERETAEQHPLEICRRIDFAINRRLTPLCSFSRTAASFFSRFSKPRCRWKDLYLL